MPTKIITKNGSGAPDAADLEQGELAVDLTNKRLYTEDSGGSVIEVGSNPSALSIAGTAVTATATELNVLDGITSTTAELNILDGVTSTASELNVLDGITATTTELNYTDGVTSNIQTQLNAKAPIDAATFTGTTTIPTADINGGAIDDTTIGGSTPAAGSFTTITGSGDMNIDSGTLFVDVSEDRVGIGTSDPKFNIQTVNGGLDSRGTGSGIAIRNNAYFDSGDKYLTASGAASTQYFDGNGNIIFYNTGTASTGAGNAVTLSEAMRIDSSGDVFIGGTSDTGTSYHLLAGNGFARHTRDAATPMIINRTTNDGDLLTFRQEFLTEGSISVSGSTVSYNGGHLSRWSQLADNTRDESIVKGTVMSNLDQMAEWTTDGVTEENEQLNCMKVSDVEADVDVAGVFVNWDNDDDIYTNDMNIAMTGDMVIRIAQDTTVQRGDLLMSAGDGTAKPQGDDIVRSKTIAKVTSTNVSHTYDDGSYLVPCVLMAC